MKRITILSFFILLSISLLSQRADFEKDEILIGDQIKFTLEISKNKGNDIVFPTIEDQLTAGIEVISISDIT